MSASFFGSIFDIIYNKLHPQHGFSKTQITDLHTGEFPGIMNIKHQVKNTDYFVTWQLPIT